MGDTYDRYKAVLDSTFLNRIKFFVLPLYNSATVCHAKLNPLLLFIADAKFNPNTKTEISGVEKVTLSIKVTACLFSSAIRDISALLPRMSRHEGLNWQDKDLFNG